MLALRLLSHLALTWKERLMEPNIHRILVPTDFSAPSERAVEYASALAANLGGSLHLVHVLDRLLSPEMGWASPAIEAVKMREHLYQESRAKLVALAAKVESHAVPASSEVRSGGPSAEIIQAAGEHGADLIVMATHGRSGLSHLVLGSVAEQVIRHARCPVLAMRDGRVRSTLGTEEHRTEKVA